MSNAPKPAKAKPRSRCLTAAYPLSTNHYLLRGLKSLSIKRMPITDCGRITCQEEIRNPMILKNVIEAGGKEGEANEACKHVRIFCE